MEHTRELQRDLLQQTRTLKAKPKTPHDIEQLYTVFQEEITAVHTAMRSAQDSAKYWETQFQSKYQDTELGKTTDRVNEMLKRQFATEIDQLRATVLRQEVRSDPHRVGGEACAVPARGQDVS